MIPNTNTKLLVAEDWKKVYQSFKNADFQSYDFDTLRRTMIQYLRENYPEDFNDFIDSSEYIALVDLIAYLGQNLSFRIDLNARENFLETAQRRDSILRLAQLVSYVPKRNVPASGFLKITAVSTTDNVIDPSGINLANTTIGWNDITNSNWYQQFMSIMNSTFIGTSVFGKPYSRNSIDGILTEQYKLNSANTDVPVYSFLKSINGTNMNFEITSAGISADSTTIIEEPPRPANSFSIIYKNDNQGASSANTGFFALFKQGTLGLASFTIDSPVPNEIVGVNTPDINDDDVWLWQLDSNGNFSESPWVKVPSISGNNVIYNSINKNERNIYSVTSRDRDQIDLNFADGSFGNLPKGQFRLLYRQSNGLTYVIRPDQMSGIVVEVPYINKYNQQQILSLTLTLQYTVNNSSGTESNVSIQNKAPQAYYTQNRMVTAEDYNIGPLIIGSDILKVKSVNRSTSGLSKYFDLKDITGKYSQTNIFATDGIVYKDAYESSFNFDFVNKNEIYAAIKQYLEPVLISKPLRSFYFDNYARPQLDSVAWKIVNKVSGESRGYFYSTINNSPLNVGNFTSSNLRYVSAGALIKFTDANNNVLWSMVKQVIGDGSNSGVGLLDDGTGPIVLSDIIPDGSTIVEVIPKFVNVLSYAFESEIVNLCANQRNFGLSFNQNTRTWGIILDTNIDLISPFSLTTQGDSTNSNLDSSWLFAFTWTGKSYKVRYRILDYIFESENETSFFIDKDSVNYDYSNGTIIKDKISVLSINTSTVAGQVSLEKDYEWQIDSAIVESDGYVEPKKVKVSFYDYNSSGQITDPDTFNNIVTTSTSFVYFKTLPDGLRYTRYTESTIIPYRTEDEVVNKTNGQMYYFYDPSVNVVATYSAATDEFIYDPTIRGYNGRAGLKFHYLHNSGEDRRIDPSKSNIIDVYLLTSAYDSEYRTWLLTGTGTEPLTPTSQSLEQNYASKLNSIKTISDELIFQPVKYKVLFGSLAEDNLQATFKAVRNPSVTISDNEIKTKILSAIDQFFSLENWDFGQTFNFSELSTYVMNLLTPLITNFVIVPKSNVFGNLYEVSCLTNEIFINGATISNIDVVESLTLSQLNLKNS